MKDKFFSIILPVAKEAYLFEAIQSLFIQGDNDFYFESIIINGTNSDIITKIV